MSKKGYVFIELLNGNVLLNNKLWDGGITEGINLGNKVKFAVIGFVTDIHYKTTKKNKLYKVIYGLDDYGDFSFSVFNNEQIFKNKAYLFIGHYYNEWYRLTKFHELKQLNNGKQEQDNEYPIGKTVWRTDDKNKKI